MAELERIPKNFQPSTRLIVLDELPERTEAERRELCLKALGVTDLNNTFEKMRQPKGFERTYKAFRLMAAGKATWHMLLVYGKTGTGKSMCCEAAVIELFDKGVRVKRWRWSDVVRHLKSLMGTPEYESFFNELRAKPRLIIDDVGSGSTLGTWEWGELEDIVDYRLENNLMTIITTNLDRQAIPDRIISRFKDKKKSRMIFNEAEDQRPL